MREMPNVQRATCNMQPNSYVRVFFYRQSEVSRETQRIACRHGVTMHSPTQLLWWHEFDTDDTQLVAWQTCRRGYVSAGLWPDLATRQQISNLLLSNIACDVRCYTKKFQFFNCFGCEFAGLLFNTAVPCDLRNTFFLSLPSVVGVFDFAIFTALAVLIFPHFSACRIYSFIACSLRFDLCPSAKAS